ncbi:MAG: DUF2283 domain-containing protein [Planctomycetaceae bacterium]|nr:DUF2283 domain-containing protein [Planctomycetaceae bacterium]
MKQNHFSVRTEIENKTGDIQAVYFTIRKGKVFETKEYSHGSALADYDKDGNLLGVELLAPVSIAVLDKISGKEPRTKAFVRNAVPREMALA